MIPHEPRFRTPELQEAWRWRRRNACGRCDGSGNLRLVQADREIACDLCQGTGLTAAARAQPTTPKEPRA